MTVGGLGSALMLAVSGMLHERSDQDQQTEGPEQ